MIKKVGFGYFDHRWWKFAIADVWHWDYVCTEGGEWKRVFLGLYFKTKHLGICDVCGEGTFSENSTFCNICNKDQ